MKRNILILAIMMLLAPNIVRADVGTLGAKGAVLIEGNSKRVLHGIKEQEQLPMASSPFTETDEDDEE